MNLIASAPDAQRASRSCRHSSSNLINLFSEVAGSLWGIAKSAAILLVKCAIMAFECSPASNFSIVSKIHKQIAAKVMSLDFDVWGICKTLFINLKRILQFPKDAYRFGGSMKQFIGASSEIRTRNLLIPGAASNQEIDSSNLAAGLIFKVLMSKAAPPQLKVITGSEEDLAKQQAKEMDASKVKVDMGGEMGAAAAEASAAEAEQEEGDDKKQKDKKEGDDEEEDGGEEGADGADGPDGAEASGGEPGGEPAGEGDAPVGATARLNPRLRRRAIAHQLREFAQTWAPSLSPQW